MKIFIFYLLLLTNFAWCVTQQDRSALERRLERWQVLISNKSASSTKDEVFVSSRRGDAKSIVFITPRSETVDADKAAAEFMDGNSGSGRMMFAEGFRRLYLVSKSHIAKYSLNNKSGMTLIFCRKLTELERKEFEALIAVI